MADELLHITVPAGRRPRFRHSQLTTSKAVQRPGRHGRSAPAIVEATKVRELWCPNGSMREIHRQLATDLTRLWSSVLGETPWITGGVPGGSPLRNVWHHRGNRYVVTFDLRGAFERVRHGRLIDLIASDLAQYNGYLMATGYEWAFIEGVVGTYCLRPGGYGLYTGAPTSPMIFNRYACHYLDGPILAVARRHGLRYNRYLDDLPISSNRPLTPELRRQLREIIEGAGFQVSWRKAGVYDLAKLGAVHLNGVGLRANGQTFVPRPYLAKVSRLVYLALRGELDDDELVTGHIAACFQLMPRDPNERNATDHRFIEAGPPLPPLPRPQTS